MNRTMENRNVTLTPEEIVNILAALASQSEDIQYDRYSVYTTEDRERFEQIHAAIAEKLTS